MNIPDEAKSLACNGADETLFVTIIADRPANCTDVASECRQGDDPSTPDSVQQLVLADHTIAIFYQVDEDIKNLGPDGD